MQKNTPGSIPHSIISNSYIAGTVIQVNTHSYSPHPLRPAGRITYNVFHNIIANRIPMDKLPINTTPVIQG